MFSALYATAYISLSLISSLMYVKFPYYLVVKFPYYLVKFPYYLSLYARQVLGKRSATFLKPPILGRFGLFFCSVSARQALEKRLFFPQNVPQVSHKCPTFVRLSFGKRSAAFLKLPIFGRCRGSFRSAIVRQAFGKCPIGVPRVSHRCPVRLYRSPKFSRKNSFNFSMLSKLRPRLSSSIQTNKSFPTLSASPSL